MMRQTKDTQRPANLHKGRNRRFVISIWLNAGREEHSTLDQLYGQIWEADAAAPGALAEPVPFESLSAVATCLERMILDDGGGVN